MLLVQFSYGTFKSILAHSELLPDNLLLAGLFLASCFISLSIGTSVGTIVALVPIAAGIAEATGTSMPFVVGVVVGGAFFGDNLSFISDTTIMATRTQGCRMSDKFRVNSMIVVPAAALVLSLALVVRHRQNNAAVIWGSGAFGYGVQAFFGLRVCIAAPFLFLCWGWLMYRLWVRVDRKKDE